MSLFSFRPALRQNATLLKEWLSQAHIRQWWGDPDSEIEGIAYHNENDDAEGFIIIENTTKKEIGYVQFWIPALCKDEPWQEFMPLNYKAIDIFIDQNELNQKKGRIILQDFAQKLFREGTKKIVFDPDCANLAPIEAAKKAGFTIYDKYEKNGRESVLMCKDAPEGANL